ncbi:unnamed protein product [Cuscuta epithymum]|nr:unnamed protein product [Cuscuta epithymum]
MKKCCKCLSFGHNKRSCQGGPIKGGANTSSAVRGAGKASGRGVGKVIGRGVGRGAGKGRERVVRKGGWKGNQKRKGCFIKHNCTLFLSCSFLSCYNQSGTCSLLKHSCTFFAHCKDVLFLLQVL